MSVSNINQRISLIAETFFNNNNSSFAAFCSTSEANIRNYRLKTVPKIEFLSIVHNRLEINYEWLISGEGEMVSTENVETSERTQELLDIISSQQKAIENLSDILKKTAAHPEISATCVDVKLRAG